MGQARLASFLLAAHAGRSVQASFVEGRPVHNSEDVEGPH